MTLCEVRLMHRVFLFMALFLGGCAATKLDKDDAVLAAYTSGLSDGAFLATHPGTTRPAPCGIPPN